MDTQSTILGGLFGFVIAFCIIIYFQTYHYKTDANESEGSGSLSSKHKKAKKKNRKFINVLNSVSNLSNLQDETVRREDVKPPHQTEPSTPQRETSSYADIARKTEDTNLNAPSKSLVTPTLDVASTTQQFRQRNTFAAPSQPDETRSSDKQNHKRIDNYHADSDANEEATSTYTASKHRLPGH